MTVARPDSLTCEEELCYLPATELAAMIRDRDVSPVEVLLAVLDRIASLDALAAENEFWHQVRQLYGRFDLLVTPALAVLPFPVGQDNTAPFPGQTARELHWTQFTYSFNLTGQPAVSVPCGWSQSELPIGLQIVGPRFADAIVLRAARAWEQLAPWSQRRPAPAAWTGSSLTLGIACAAMNGTRQSRGWLEFSVESAGSSSRIRRGGWPS